MEVARPTGLPHCAWMLELWPEHRLLLASPRCGSLSSLFRPRGSRGDMGRLPSKDRAVVAPAVSYPELPADASPLDRAAATCAWLRARIRHAESTGAETRELALLGSQLNTANRLHARLSGALDITEAQIVRSAPWAKIMVVMRDVLRKHPKALAEVAQAVEELAEGER